MSAFIYSILLNVLPDARFLPSFEHMTQARSLSEDFHQSVVLDFSIHLNIFLRLLTVSYSLVNVIGQNKLPIAKASWKSKWFWIMEPFLIEILTNSPAKYFHHSGTAFLFLVRSYTGPKMFSSGLTLVDKIVTKRLFC